MCTATSCTSRDLARRNPSVNVWIHDSTFRRNGRQGIAIVSATNVIIERNRIDHTRRSTVDLEPNGSSWRISNVFILDNSVGRGALLFVASHGQGPVDNVVIEGNQLQGHDLTIDAMPPGKDRRSNWVIKNNVSDTTVHHRPMRFFGIDGLVVTGNTQRVSNKEPGVVMNGDCGTQAFPETISARAPCANGARVATRRSPSRRCPTSTVGEKPHYHHHAAERTDLVEPAGYDGARRDGSVEEREWWMARRGGRRVGARRRAVVLPRPTRARSPR